MGLAQTIAWYRAHRGWVSRVRSGEDMSYDALHYGRR